MVKHSLKLCGGLLAGALFLVAAGLWWLLGSLSGAEWLLARANDQGVVRVEAGIRGSLWTGLDLTDLQVTWPTGRATTDRLRLVWRPQALFSRHLGIDELEFGATRIVLAPTPSTPDPGLPESLPLQAHDLWPQLPGWVSGSTAEVGRLAVTELSFATDNEAPLVLHELRGNLRLDAALLQVEGLHVGLPCGLWDGSIGLDLGARQVTTDLVWEGAPFVADWNRVQTRLTLDENLAGSFQAETLAGSVERMTLQADARLTTTGVTLAALKIARSDAPDQISGLLQVNWSEAFSLSGELRVTHLNLEAEAGWPTDLTGPVQLALTADGYAATVVLESLRPGYEQGHLTAAVAGDWQGLDLSGLQAAWLGGTVAGDLRIDWQEGVQLSGALRGRDLNPELLSPAVTGRLHFSGHGALQIPRSGELSANWELQLEPSELQHYPLQGEISGRWQDQDLVLTRLDLTGNGLHLKGRGELSRRIDLQVQIDDLSRLAEGWQGGLQGAGWLARTEGRWTGSGSGELHDLSLDELQAGSGRFNLDYPGPDAESQLELSLSGLSLPGGRLDALAVTGTGSLEEHTLDLRLDWPSGSLNSELSGGWFGSDWRGRIQTLAGHEDLLGAWHLSAPAALTLAPERVELQLLQLLGEQGGLVDLTADLRTAPLTGKLLAGWQDFPLGFLAPLLAEGTTLEGTATGELQLSLDTGGELEVAAEIFSAPVIHYQNRELALRQSYANLHWGADGLVADSELWLARGGRLYLGLDSMEPGRLSLPQGGDIKASWEKLDLQQLAPWLPDTLALKGLWQGGLSGRWQQNALLNLTGKTWIEEGELEWRGGDGVIHLPLRQAELSGLWQDGWLAGELQFSLAEHGRIDGRFRLPVAQGDRTAVLDATAKFELDELGLLMLLMPGITNETHGLLKGDLRLAGNWDRPQLFGTLSLRGAGADVPALGLKLRDAEIEATFNQDALRLDRVQLVSGAGRLVGDGALQLAGWRLQDWSLNLQGKNVQLVDLPELSMAVSPDLQIDGTLERLSVQGKVDVPTLLIYQAPKGGAIEPSTDVVLTDAEPVARQQLFEKREVKLQITLGNQVLVKAKGLDARLEGGLEVATDAAGAFTGKGEIRVVQGHYAAYGLKLPITRGRLSFGGGDLQNPVLDVLAERTVAEIKAGVQVTGTPRKPVVKLVSDPTLPDTEILSYIVLGRPLGTTSDQNDSLMLAAGALMSQGGGAGLQEQLRRQVGVDVLEVQSGSNDGVEGSMVAVGKYLTPELYLSFGQSLFTPQSVAKLRYQFGKRWELESQLGTVSGADLSYRIEFR
jgi:translocation and assembly module TamB